MPVPAVSLVLFFLQVRPVKGTQSFPTQSFPSPFNTISPSLQRQTFSIIPPPLRTATHSPRTNNPTTRTHPQTRATQPPSLIPPSNLALPRRGRHLDQRQRRRQKTSPNTPSPVPKNIVARVMTPRLSCSSTASATSATFRAICPTVTIGARKPATWNDTSIRITRLSSRPSNAGSRDVMRNSPVMTTWGVIGRTSISSGARSRPSEARGNDVLVNGAEQHAGLGWGCMVKIAQRRISSMVRRSWSSSSCDESLLSCYVSFYVSTLSLL